MSDLEEHLLFQMKAIGLPEPEREHKFHPTRRWKFDFVWKDKMIAVECEGMSWKYKKKSRHTQAAGFLGDCEKYNHATELGWQVYRFPSKMIYEGTALNFIERILEKS